MIIIRLQIAVCNSGNVQVKWLEYFSRFLGGDYNKGKQVYLEIPPLHLDSQSFICLRLGFRFTLALLTVENNIFLRNKMGI
jgi:hypothetical protein